MDQPYGALPPDRVGLPKASVGPLHPGAENRIFFLEFAEQRCDVELMNADAIGDLISQARQLSSEAGGELERCCWMVVHEHHHGVKPTEYDIREIDEQLYLAVLNGARSAGDP